MSLPNGFKIVSGGQSGADRAALDVALGMNIPCGGWCPEDRMAEDGPIDARYPLLPAPGAGNRERTRLNVRDSNGTVIFSFGPLGGGSLSTCEDCLEMRRPYLVIDADRLTTEEAAESAATFISDHDIRTLNVAGQRESEDVRVYEYVRRMMRVLLTK